MTLALTGSLLIKVTLLLALALLVDQLLRRRRVLTVATFWNAVLLALFALPLATILVPQLTLPLLPSITPPILPADSEKTDPKLAAAVALSQSQSAAVGHRAVEADAVQPSESANVMTQFLGGETFVLGLMLALVVIYVLGAMTLVARLVAGWLAANSLRREAILVADSQWRDRLHFWSGHLEVAGQQSAGGTRRVTLLESDQIDVPVALGVRRPAIVVPSHLVAQASPQTVDVVLVHELAHVYRADCAWQLLDHVVQAAFWPHPLMWIAQKRIAFIRERACDDFAVRRVGDFQAYGETLLDIASRMAGRRSLKLGLTIVRPSNLERRLNAIAESGGSNRCVAGPAARWLLTTAMVLAAVVLAGLGVGRAAAHALSGSPNPQQDPPAPGRTPELIAVTWQQVPQSDNKRIEQPVWRPDGKRFTDAEANALLDKVKSFQAHWWNQGEQLRPLVLVYQASPGIRTGLSTALVRPGGRRVWSGTWHNTLPNGLAKSASAPPRMELMGWPAKVDLDVKVPLEDPQVIKTVNVINTVKSNPGPVEVAEGVRWYIDKQRGADFSKRDRPRYGLTAGVLEVKNDSLDNLTRYDVRVWLRGAKEPLPSAYVTAMGTPPQAVTTIYVSQALEDPAAIVRIEFTRQRFRFERIKNVETHLDLLPPDPSAGVKGGSAALAPERRSP
jgi:beta-lactamase regulating signal transducer with metallopeptidase domain